MPHETDLERLLSQPVPAVVEALSTIEGDIVVLGAAGKMGPSLARLAARSLRAAGRRHRVIAVARFSNTEVRDGLERDGVETIQCDLADAAQLASLPDARNIVYMVGQKFGTTGDEARTWGLNAWLPGAVASRYPQSRMVAFSTGNVYPLAPSGGPGPSEMDPTGPVGEYAQSTLARERVLEFFSRRNGTPMAILRLNYAIEPRYGVLRDIADRVREGKPVDVGMGWVNVIWQRDANAIALRALGACSSPPMVLNVTGRPAVSVRWLAERFGSRWGVAPTFAGTEAPTALLSDASRMEARFGAPAVGINEMIDLVAEWVEQGGRSLNKPTHFESREGAF
jgi:nucleoside-diphosphate-sugar epimerase